MAGYFVGANTCEPCKTFFRRSLVDDKVIKPCRFDGKCADNPNGKIPCTQCRHRKCLAVGMHKEGDVVLIHYFIVILIYLGGSYLSEVKDNQLILF